MTTDTTAGHGGTHLGADAERAAVRRAAYTIARTHLTELPVLTRQQLAAALRDAAAEGGVTHVVRALGHTDLIYQVDSVATELQRIANFLAGALDRDRLVREADLIPGEARPE